MLGRSTPELIFVRLGIPLLRYPFFIYPLVIWQGLVAYDAQPEWKSLREWLVLAICLLVAAEAAFYLLIFRPAERRLRDEARHPPPLTSDERKALFQNCAVNIPDPEQYLKMWFLGRDTAELARGDVVRFLAWAFFDLDLDTESASRRDEEELEAYMQAFEALLGRKLPEGKTGAECLRLTVDAVEIRYRNVVWYLIVFLIDLITCVSLWSAGFGYRPAQQKTRTTMRGIFPPRPHLLLSPRSPSIRGNHAELGYWSLPHTTVNPNTLPVVFLHGIGVGLWAYTTFISSVPAGTGVMMPEFLNISGRIIVQEPPTKAAFLATLEEMLENEGWDDFVLVTHSYGSVLATHILHSPLAGRVKAVTLIDPVSLCLHLPDVAFSFTRRLPRWANEWQLWYFASMDLGIAHTLGRHFFWRENIVWKKDLVGGMAARKVTVCLSEKDLIVDTLAVARYLLGDESVALSDDGGLVWPGNHAGGMRDLEDSAFANHFTTQDGIEVLWLKGLDHAQVFDRAVHTGLVMGQIKKQCVGSF